jgi:hypothetical protein
MEKGIFYGTVKDGRVHLDNRAMFDSWIKNFEGRRIQMEVGTEDESHTINQFRYLYACVYSPLGEYLGYTAKEIDGLCKKKFLTKVIKKGNKVKTYVQEKKDLSKKELAEYIDECIRLAAENGVVVLPPNKFFKTERKKDGI